MLEIRGVEVLVVGAGTVAARKIGDLVACGAVVTVVAPDVCDEAAAAGAARIERRAYCHGEAARYRLVITATGVADVDGAVWADADGAGVWVNAADDPDHCSFILPAVLRRPPVTVAVSTDGASPALAGWLRDRLGERLGPEVGEVAAELGVQRRRAMATGETVSVEEWHRRIAEAFMAQDVDV
jgi:precorrin-2 dehydrogenase / sirohydrochlorin ferrochelatase